MLYSVAIVGSHVQFTTDAIFHFIMTVYFDLYLFLYLFVFILKPLLEDASRLTPDTGDWSLSDKQRKLPEVGLNNDCEEMKQTIFAFKIINLFNPNRTRICIFKFRFWVS